jgi:hypothetical protein
MTHVSEKGAQRMTSLRIAILALMTFGGGAAAQTPAQGDWPCKQVRVPEIALGGVWSGPAIDGDSRNWRDDGAVADLVSRIRQRRTPLSDAEKSIADFARAAGAERKALLTRLFAGTYESMNDERREVINGLDRFGRRLKDMAAMTRRGSEDLRKLQDQKPVDPEAIRKASETLQWQLRLFEEQRRMATYVCESPALIEQRLGALARAIATQMN